QDKRGIICHFCHTMVDPIYDADSSAPGDQPILNALSKVPQGYGNAMFVLDPHGLRRGPYPPEPALHPAIKAEFIESSNLCGTCHDVGKPTLVRQASGTYAKTSPGPTTQDDLAQEFPLERTYTEWRLSDYAI